MQRYFASSKRDQEFDLEKNDMHHIKNVMRMNRGDLIEVVFQEELYLCTVDTDNVKLKEKLAVSRNNGPELVLIIPFLKEQKMDLILQKGTELGVSKFIVVESERSIVKIEAKKESARLERWSKICKEASEQSMRVNIPIVVIERDIDHLEGLDGLKLICSTGERVESIKKVLKKVTNCDIINIMIGPEGGFSFKEEIYFEKKGFIKVNLGTNIMRTETVPIFLSSIISYEYME